MKINNIIYITAITLLSSASAFAASSNDHATHAKAWEQAAHLVEISTGENGGGPGLIFSSEVDDLARQLAAGAKAEHEKADVKAPLFIIQSDQSTGG